jgi:hypothetical protein
MSCPIPEAEVNSSLPLLEMDESVILSTPKVPPQLDSSEEAADPPAMQTLVSSAKGAEKLTSYAAGHSTSIPTHTPTGPTEFMDESSPVKEDGLKAKGTLPGFCYAKEAAAERYKTREPHPTAFFKITEYIV